MTHVRQRREPAPPRHAKHGARHACLRPGLKRLLLILIPALIVGGCVGASGPQIKTVVRDSFSIETIGETSIQRVGNLTVEDLGEAKNVIQPVRVQACDGSYLKYGRKERKTRNGKRYVRRYPVFETVDPLQGIYVRKLRIRNDTGHVLRLNRIDAVLSDAAGNDNALFTRSALRHSLFATRPCSSTEGVVESLRGVKLLGTNIRIRPGRAAELFAAFSGVDPRIVGDWTLELYDVPVATDPNGRVSHAASIEFPLLARGFRTTVTMRREKLFQPSAIPSSFL